MNVVCVLLAAGLGTRMDGDKLLTLVEGKMLIEHAAALAKSLPFSESVAVVRPGDEAVLTTVEKAGLRPVFNPYPARGIASSLVIGLSDVMRSDPDGVLFLVGDQPRLTAKTVESMLRAFESDPESIVRPRSSSGKPGNPVLFPKSLFPELAALTGDTGGKTVVAAHPDRVRFILCASDELRDIDAPQDLRA